MTGSDRLSIWFAIWSVWPTNMACRTDHRVWFSLQCINCLSDEIDHLACFLDQEADSHIRYVAPWIAAGTIGTIAFCPLSWFIWTTPLDSVAPD